MLLYHIDTKLTILYCCDRKTSCCLGPQPITGPGLVQWQPRDDTHVPTTIPTQPTLPSTSFTQSFRTRDAVSSTHGTINLDKSTVSGRKYRKKPRNRSACNAESVARSVKIESDAIFAANPTSRSQRGATAHASSATIAKINVENINEDNDDDKDSKDNVSNNGNHSERKYENDNNDTNNEDKNINSNSIKTEYVTPWQVASGVNIAAPQSHYTATQHGENPNTSDEVSSTFDPLPVQDNDSAARVSNAFAIVRNHKILWRVIMPCIQAALKICYRSDRGCARAKTSAAPAAVTAAAPPSTTGAASASAAGGAADHAAAAAERRLWRQAELYTIGAEYALAFGSVCECVGAADCRHQTATPDYLSCGCFVARSMLQHARHSAPWHARAAALMRYVDAAHARCQSLLLTTNAPLRARVVTMRDTPQCNIGDA